MGAPPRCFCGRPTQAIGSVFICALAKCAFRVSSASVVHNPALETCAHHGEPIEIITQRPVGHLPGRRYARCSLPAQQRCSYFRLIQTVPPGSQPRQGFPTQTKRESAMSAPFFRQPQQTSTVPNVNAKQRSPSSSRHPPLATGGEPHPNIPKCRCGSLANQKKVMKEGPNKGKAFFVCAKPRGSQCQFFEWAHCTSATSDRVKFGNGSPVIGQATSAANGLNTSQRTDRRTGIGGAHPNPRNSNQTELELSTTEEEEQKEEECPNCICGNSAVRRRVKKQGPNHGKDFFVCAKRQDQQCRFFEWAKQTPANTSAILTKRVNDRSILTHGSDVAKRPRFSPKGKITLDLHEIDTLTFSLHLAMPSELCEAVKKFTGVKITKTEMLGVEKVLIPITKLSKLEHYLMASAGAKVECTVPEKILNRATNYLVAEKKREENGDVVKRSLEELLPSLVCEKLMQFQWHGVHFALKRGGRCLIGDDMGLGKTLQAIAVAKVYSSDWPLLVICPSSLRLNWKEELLAWLEEDLYEEDVLVIMTGKDVDRPLRRVTIVSYDLFRKIPERSLKRVNFVIADESHYLKSASALRSKAVIPLVKRAKRALLLSGTPALSRPVELFPQINAILPNLFPSYREFVERYCAAHQGHFGYDVSGASNLSELHTLLRGSVLIRRKKEEVLTQLPDKQRQVIWVQTKPQLMKKVSQAMQEMESAKAAVNEVDSEERGHGLQNAVNVARNDLYKLTGLAKLEAILEVCKDTADTGCKFIVFGHHSQILEALDSYATKKLRLDIIRIDGRTPQAARQGLCKKFQTDPSCRIALLSITAAGVGLTLTAAKVVLFAELYWNPGSLLQAEDRAHRIGQKDCVLVKYLLARNTIDESMWSTVRRKLNVVGQSLTGTAARMDAKDENMQSSHKENGGIERFFQREGRASENKTVFPGKVEIPHAEHDSVIEVLDNSLPASTSPAVGLHLQTEHEISSDVPLPTSLQDAGSLLENPDEMSYGPLFSDLPDSVDLRASLQAQRQLDQDIALARRLQAQFDAEELGQ